MKKRETSKDVEEPKTAHSTPLNLDVAASRNHTSMGTGGTQTMNKESFFTVESSNDGEEAACSERESEDYSDQIETQQKPLTTQSSAMTFGAMKDSIAIPEDASAVSPDKPANLVDHQVVKVPTVDDLQRETPSVLEVDFVAGTGSMARLNEASSHTQSAKTLEVKFTEALNGDVGVVVDADDELFEGLDKRDEPEENELFADLEKRNELQDDLNEQKPEEEMEPQKSEEEDTNEVTTGNDVVKDKAKRNSTIVELKEDEHSFEEETKSAENCQQPLQKDAGVVEGTEEEVAVLEIAVDEELKNATFEVRNSSDFRSSSTSTNNAQEN